MAFDSEEKRVYVCHPGVSSLVYEMTDAFNRNGFRSSFFTGIYYRDGGRLNAVIRAVPGRLGRTLDRELKRRQRPGMSVSRIWMRPALELLFVAVSRAGASNKLLAWALKWRNDVFDRRVAKIVRQDAPDFVIGHETATKEIFLAARAAGSVSIMNQLIGHVGQGLRILEEEARLQPAFAASLHLETMRKMDLGTTDEAGIADLILVASDYVRSSMIAADHPGDKILVVPYGVDVMRFQPAAREPRPGLRALFVGQISQRKGISYLLDAMRQLAPLGVELTLVGPIMGDARMLAHYSDFVKHIPNVPFQEVHSLYQDADVFVYPSLHEGSAMAIYEALASGLPVVTTFNSGSVVRDGEEGFIVPIRDAGAIVRSLETLAHDRQLREAMSNRARARALDFSWEHYGERLRAALRPHARRT